MNRHKKKIQALIKKTNKKVSLLMFRGIKELPIWLFTIMYERKQKGIQENLQG